MSAIFHIIITLRIFKVPVYCMWLWYIFTYFMTIAIVLWLRWNFDRLQCLFFSDLGPNCGEMEVWPCLYFVWTVLSGCKLLWSHCFGELIPPFFFKCVCGSYRKQRNCLTHQNLKLALKTGEKLHISQLSRSEAFFGKRKPMVSCTFFFFKFFFLSI